MVAPDLPGWGATPLPTEPFSFVDVVAAELPAILVGNSFGGAVALRTALAHQDMVERLVLVGAGLPAWDWTEEMRDYFTAEGGDRGRRSRRRDRDQPGVLGRPAHRDEVRPQQRLALELQTAHEEPEVHGPSWRRSRRFGSRRSSSLAKTTRRTSSRSPSTSPRRSPTRTSRSSPAPVISSASISPRS